MRIKIIILSFLLLFNGCSTTTQIKPQIEYGKNIVLRGNSYIYKGDKYYFNKTGIQKLNEIIKNNPEAQFEFNEYERLNKINWYDVVIGGGVIGYGIYCDLQKRDYTEDSPEYKRYETNSNICTGITIALLPFYWYKNSEAIYHLKKTIMFYNEGLKEK